MKTKNFIVQTAVYFLIASIFYGCANPVSPGGGPRDTQPPGVISSNPPNYSLFFDKQKISITFDEFVKLKNPNQQVLISPPLKNKPEFKLRGKNLLIEFEEEFMPGTTYTIFFGNAIVDLTEENPLVNYLYVFSTGDHIDSLAIAGEVVNAFDLQPRDDVFVMLFAPTIDTIPQDSIPMFARPLYISKTDENGQFQLLNLRDQEYRLFALKDVNSNYKFDQPNEEIAFIDSLVSPIIPDVPTTVIDTLTNGDSLALLPDSLIYDTLVLQNMFKEYYQLFLFAQIDSTQRLLDEEVFYPPKFRINYKFPAKDPKFSVINKELDKDWKIEELNRGRDSLLVWVRDMELDSLHLVVADDTTILDTLWIVFSREKKNAPIKKGKKNDDIEIVERIEFKTSLNGRILDLGHPFRMVMANPLDAYDFEDVFFVAAADTMQGAPFKVLDSLNRIFELDYEMTEATRYEFLFPDSILFDIYGLTNDSLQASFSTGRESDYGNLILNISIEDSGYPYILQLLDQKENILKETYISESQTVSYQYLKPGSYLIKAVQDKWSNKHWDTGIYVEKRQPENVFYFPAEINIRANWDMKESWQLP